MISKFMSWMWSMMEMPGGLLLLLILQFFTGNNSVQPGRPVDNSTGVEGQVRLANEGNSSCSGRVEIFLLGQWGTVCDDHWDLVDAHVVCRQLVQPGRPVDNSTGVEGQVRLANEGNSSCSGRVEIFLLGQWGTVCDDHWDLVDAHVVCRQLGCGRARSAPQSARFGQGSGPIWLDNVICSGREPSITDCRHPGLGVHNCGHNEDASVVCECSTGVEGQVRLANEGNSSCSGRVEIFLLGQWGTVCDDHWDLVDAHVVCRQLGCGRARSAPQSARFGQGSGPIWLDNVICSGREPSITDCRHPGLGVHNCGHNEDASVVFEGQVRLANEGNSSCSGRVEIFLLGQWGTVCDDHWDLVDAHVVCRQLGCGRARSAPQSARFGQGSGPIWLDNVICSGREPSITDCRHPGLGVHNCGHNEDASVVCEFQQGRPVDNSTGVEGQVRLANEGNSSCSGRVEIFLRGQWGTVCDDHWDLVDAHVVCRQLGCGRARSAPQSARFGQGSGPIWLDNVICSGREPSITDCRHPGLGVHNCGHNEDASVVFEGQVRLANEGNSSCSGRVEIFLLGQWGTVCDDHWDLVDAHVVCRQLGCGRARSAPQHARFGQGSGPIWLDNVICSGREPSITDCRHPGLGVHNCVHNEDASVVCEGVEGQVRLANEGNSSCSGRVEIFLLGQWGTVCDDHWDLVDAHVVCRQLGCGRARSAPQSARFGQGSGPIWLDNVICSGREPSITDCRHPGLGVHNFQPGRPVDNSTGVEGQVRLANEGNSSCSGRVEIFLLGQWGTVCDDHWDLVDAHVVCRQLGCGRARSAPQSARFGQGSGPIWLDNTNRTHAIYSNSLYLYRGNVSFSRPVSLPFSCAYPLDTDVSMNVAVRPVLPSAVGLSGLGSKARASMSLFHTSNFTQPYPSGLITLPVGSPLHVGVSVLVRDPSFVVVLENCYASNSSNSNDTAQYFFIQNKCPTDRQQVAVIESGSSRQARFSVLFLLIHGENSDIYLHCSLSLCDQRSSRCVPSCRRRTSRSASSSAPLKPLTIGPITWDKSPE
ncbi:deleted in malignant brain tumors 1 protein [Limanda limanda]|uniref:deleted in malignant brain tumors 1 protein n=1 Tax=Limanda limanda TaxID=27771 RepID=UPI0029C98636|nr:deleted in malignant brain tumors 1 protein [Limanda limanda]